MARIRSIKPEFWSDYRLARDLTRDERLFYIALWNEADDEGRFLAHPRRLLGVAFPYDDDIHESFIERSLNRLAETERLVLYQVGGEPYGQLTKFGDHQRVNRPQPSKLPAPPALTALTEHSVNDHGQVTAVDVDGCGDVVVGGDGDNHPSIQPREDFAISDVENSEVGPDSPDAPPPDTTPAAPRAAMPEDLEDQISKVIITANGAMARNPEIDQRRLTPIPTGHGSRQHVHDWLQEGIPFEFVQEVVADIAASYRPDQHNKQISTMKYFDGAVRQRHELQAAKAATGGAAPRRDSRRSNGTRGRASPPKFDYSNAAKAGEKIEWPR